MDELKKNVDRFNGFAELYDESRPAMPLYPVEIIRRYLGKPADTVVDLGCGTGLSALIWHGHCRRIIGVEPGDDMRAVAARRQRPELELVKAYAQATGLEAGCADAVVCSQSFHWMEPTATLREAARLLREGGVFAAVDCDWPPVSQWPIERAYDVLFAKVRVLEQEQPQLRDSFIRYPKDRHLANIRGSGAFRHTREIVFCNSESCTAERLISLARSQGGLQAILKRHPEWIEPELSAYESTVREVCGDRCFDIEFCYRMRIGVK